MPFDRDLVAGALSVALSANPGSSGRELERYLWEFGLTTDKRQINSVLYSRRDRFWSVGQTPPRWHLITTDSRSPQAEIRPTRHGSGPFELYAWQADALSAWHDQDRRGVIEAITGAGKTMIGLVAAWEELELGGAVQVLVPSIVLLNQWAELLTIHLPGKQIGRLGGGERDGLEDVDVLVSVINSAREVEVDPAGRHALIIADECHRYATVRNAQALDEDVFESRLGLSATYARTDDGHLDLLDPFFGGTCYEFGYSDALRNEVTAHFKVSLVAVDFDDEERSVYSESDEQARRHRSWLINNAGVRPEPFGLFMQDVSALAEGGHEEGTVRSRGYLHAFNARRRILAETRSKLELLDELVPAIESADKTLVFTETQESSEEAAEKLESWGLGAAAIHAQIPLEVRKQLLSDFARGSISVLCAPRVLDEGVDVPAADLGVILAASHSQRQMIQRMGRLLRRKSDGRLARFVISFVRDTSEDPNTGAHETFLERITEVADTVSSFDGVNQADEVCAFLNDYQWLGPIPQPLMAAD